MRVLVTGASGFVGEAVARAFLAEGAEVTSLGRRAAGLAGVEDVIVEDVANDGVPSGLSEFDVVAHLAAAGVDPADRDALRLCDVNIRMGVRLLEEVDAKSYVFAGSSAEYADKTGAPLTEGDRLQQLEPYGASKAAGGLVHISLANAVRKPLAVLRLFHVYGPGERSHRLTTSLIGRLKQRERVALTAGKQVRDFLFVEDAAQAFVAASRQVTASEVSARAFNVSTGRGTSVRDVCCLMASLLGVPEELLGLGDIPLRQDEFKYVVGDNSSFVKATGWSPTISLEEGLRRIISRSDESSGVKSVDDLP